MFLPWTARWGRSVTHVAAAKSQAPRIWEKPMENPEIHGINHGKSRFFRKNNGTSIEVEELWKKCRRKLAKHWKSWNKRVKS